MFNKETKTMKPTLIFDLDETVINSLHRTPNNPDGTLNLDAYRAKHSRKNVFKDKLLPLARVMRTAKKQGYHIVILTARDMAKFDYDYLKFHRLDADLILSRDKADKAHYNFSDGDYKAHYINLHNLHHGIMIDDSPKVKTALRAIGMPVLCAHKLNARLAK